MNSLDNTCGTCDPSNDEGEYTLVFPFDSDEERDVFEEWWLEAGEPSWMEWSGDAGFSFDVPDPVEG